jgi:hypothetical protein
MRIAGYAICVLLGATLLSAQQDRQNAKGCDAAKEREMFATNRGWSKGGIGIISEELYVVVKSARNDRNELILTPPGHLGKDQTAPVPETRWKGKSISEAEVVFVYEGKVWESRSLPKGFDLSKSVVISFESDKVRFFDFRATEGGYYDRISE